MENKELKQNQDIIETEKLDNTEKEYVEPDKFDFLFDGDEVENNKEKPSIEGEPSSKKEKEKKSSQEGFEKEDKTQEIQKEDKKLEIDWKSKAEKESKRLKETQSWGNDLQKKLNAHRKATEALLENVTNGYSLEEDEVKAILEHTQYLERSTEEPTDFERGEKILYQEIENIRKYGSYEDLDEHFNAFRHLVGNITQEELNNLLDENGVVPNLFEEDPVLYTKKLLDIGREYYEDIYEHFSKSGSLKGFKGHYEEIINNKDKTIDKLEKEIVKLKKRHEDYDESPNYRIPQGMGGASSGDFEKVDVMNDPGKFMNEFHQGKAKVG